MSEHAARSCNGKQRYKSQRRADDIARRTQRNAGVAMKGYPCDICKGFHIGAIQLTPDSVWRTSRKQRKQQYAIDRTNRAQKFNFRKALR